MDPKKVIRSEVSDAMSSLSAGARSAASLMLAGQVRRVIADRQPGCVMGFLADAREIDFDPAITELLTDPRMTVGVPIVSVDQGRMTCGRLPSLQSDALVTDRYGIRTPRPPADPIEPATLDLIFVPGVAFTRDGRRLGRGGGYYDRFMADLPPTTWRIGVCHARQIRADLPIGGHDVPVDELLIAPEDPPAR
ncbi:MAG: 5-formyltetrahydrofolate cyclo-ligase [Phycisphaerales bacterium]|nr:5-formyltetrahydrofolate cyclo-ligase [Phycisphaerales bacterium]